MTSPVRPIRVLQLLVSTRAGGGPHQVYETIRRLPRSEFEWVIGAPDDGAYSGRFAEIGTVRHLALDRIRPGIVIDVARVIRSDAIDVVHSHGKGAGLYGRLAARAAGVPAIHTFHGIHDTKYGRVGGAAYRALERALGRLSYAVVHVSASQAREGERLGLTRGRAVVIPNGIDADETRALARDQPLSPATLGVPAGRPVIVCVARLDPVKGVDVLVQALARLGEQRADVYGLIVGDGPERPRLGAMAASLGVSGRTVFAGEVPDAPRLFSSVDVYVSASRGEGLPLAVLEAMACGLPIVATRIPVHEELLGNGRAGLLVPVDDPEAMAEAIDRLVVDRTSSARLGEAARKEVERYDVRTGMEALAALYRQAARRDAEPRPEPERGV